MAYTTRTRTVEITERVYQPEWYILMMEGRRIDAIRSFRSAYGTDLKTSKDVIDGFQFVKVASKVIG